MDRLEKELGFKLVFPMPSHHWIPGWARFNLTRHWRRAGLRLSGLNYFTIGNLKQNVSTRFDENAMQYQSWIGGYLVKLDSSERFSFQQHLNLAIVDQCDWLKHYGDPIPLCKLNSFDFKKVGSSLISGYPADIFEGGGLSHSDVGPQNAGIKTWLVAILLAAVLKSSGNNLQLVAGNLIPSSSNKSYDRLFLNGLFICVKIDSNTRAVLFANGVVPLNPANQSLNTFDVLRTEFLDLLERVSIVASVPG